jgi:serine/threonine protein kinase
VTRREFQPGETIAGQYLVVQEIGRGGFGVVYLAVQESVQRYVAVKTVQPDMALAVEHDLVASFRREALHTSRLTNPNTITLFDYGETDEGVLFLVTEFLDGEPLGSAIERDAPFPIPTAVHLLKQIASSLAEAHDIGLVHGDLKPDNIFVLEQPGDEHFVKVLDFGIAQVIGSAHEAGMGTPQYMAPEQFDGNPALPASDIYAAGLILFEILTGKRVFGDFAERIASRQTPPDVRFMLPLRLRTSAVGALVGSLTDPDPARRCQSGMGLLRELQSLQSRYTLELDANESLAEGYDDGPAPAQITQPTRAGLARTLHDKERYDTPPKSFLVWGRSDPLEGVRSVLDTDETPHVIGRTAEKARLLGLLDGMRSGGAGQIVLLGGNLGVGKSDLMRWLRREVELMGQFGVGWVQCEQDAVSPVSNLARALASALLDSDDTSNTSPQAVQAAMVDILGRGLSSPELQTVLTSYGFLFDPTGRHDAPLGDLMCAIAERRRLVLFVDDLEFATVGDLRTLDAIASHLDRSSLQLVIVSAVCRDVLPDQTDLARGLLTLATSHECFTNIVIDGLDEPDQVTVVRDHFRRRVAGTVLDAEVNPELVSMLLRRGHGNPSVLRELVDYLVDSDQLLLGEHGVTFKPAVDPDRLVAPSITTTMSRRVAARLGRHVNRKDLQLTLLRCAMLGQTFGQELLLRLLIAEGESGHVCATRLVLHLDELLRTLVSEDILLVVEDPDDARPEAKRWAFSQALMHQFVQKRADHLPNASAVHRLVAAAKEPFYASTAESPYRMAEVRSHIERAQRPDPAYAPDGWDLHRQCWRYGQVPPA